MKKNKAHVASTIGPCHSAGITAPLAFQVMIQPAGATCNLHCRYCYYLAKEALYPGSDFRMAPELLERFTQQFIAAQKVPQVTFAWQGGEPTLLGLDFFKQALEFQQKYQKNGLQIINTLQTNGTLLDDEWCRFFKEHDFLIGISIDGPEKLHDVYRQDKRGNPTFQSVQKGVAYLKKHEVDFNTLTTLHFSNADYPEEVYRFLKDDVGAKFIQFIPIVERKNCASFPKGQSVTERSITAAQFGNFLNRVFDCWVKADVGRVFVQYFDVALALWAGMQPGLCSFAQTCGAALALEHNGDLYSCDHFVEPRYKLGNIQEKTLLQLVGSLKQYRFGQDKRDQLPRYCQKCPFLFACFGGCPKDRFINTPHGEPGLNYLCAGYQTFFRHIQKPMQIMVNLLKERRPPADIMYLLANESRCDC